MRAEGAICRLTLLIAQAMCTHQNLKCAPPGLKISRMALGKTLKHKTSIDFAPSRLLPKVGVRLTGAGAFLHAYVRAGQEGEDTGEGEACGIGEHGLWVSRSVGTAVETQRCLAT